MEAYKKYTRYIQIGVSRLTATGFCSEKEAQNFVNRSLEFRASDLLVDLIRTRYQDKIERRSYVDQGKAFEVCLPLVICSIDEFNQLVNEAVEAKLEAEYG